VQCASYNDLNHFNPEKDELPITNNNNLQKAISTSKSMLRVQLFKESGNVR
jgi:hypothetical protein